MHIVTEDQSDIENKLSFLFDVIKRYDHYVATTNFKVGLMMSFVGAIVLGVFIQIIALTPSGNIIYCLAVQLSVFTIITSLIVAIHLLRVVFPNTKSHDLGKSLIFFGDVSKATDGPDGYVKLVEKATTKEVLEDLSKQTFVMAEIVNEKFRLLKLSVRMLMYGVIPLLGASLLLIILAS